MGSWEEWVDRREPRGGGRTFVWDTRSANTLRDIREDWGDVPDNAQIRGTRYRPGIWAMPAPLDFHLFWVEYPDTPDVRNV